MMSSTHVSTGNGECSHSAKDPIISMLCSLQFGSGSALHSSQWGTRDLVEAIGQLAESVAVLVALEKDGGECGSFVVEAPQIVQQFDFCEMRMVIKFQGPSQQTKNNLSLWFSPRKPQTLTLTCVFPAQDTCLHHWACLMWIWALHLERKPKLQIVIPLQLWHPHLMCSIIFSFFLKSQPLQCLSNHKLLD